MERDFLAAAKRIADETRARLPQEILSASGRALYSPAATLAGRSAFYFLGLNPGESESGDQFHDVLTVADDLVRLETNQVTVHAYLDERWKGYSAGAAPIQRAGQQIFALLAASDQRAGLQLLRDTPVSNFILQRSPSEAVLAARTGARPVDLALACWPFHAAVLRETRARVVITHAVVIARKLARALGLGEGEQRPSGWGGTLSTLYAWQLNGEVALLAMPNLSRYKPDGPRTDALRRFFAEFVPARAASD